MAGCGVHHLRISVSDLERSKGFWAPVLTLLGFTYVNQDDDRICFQAGSGNPPLRFLISQAPTEYCQQKFELGMIGWHHLSFSAETRQQVDDLYQLLLELGAPTQGPPGSYGYAPGYYAVYFRDPDNLKFELAHVPSVTN